MTPANIFVTSDLYKAGNTEDGDAFTAECYYVVAEDAQGARWAHRVTFYGCKVERCPEDGYNVFIDIREEATAKAEALAARVRAAGAIDLTHWSEIDPAYGSDAYVSSGTEAKRYAAERAAG